MFFHALAAYSDYETNDILSFISAVFPLLKTFVILLVNINNTGLCVVDNCWNTTVNVSFMNLY